MVRTVSPLLAAASMIASAAAQQSETVDVLATITSPTPPLAIDVLSPVQFGEIAKPNGTNAANVCRYELIVFADDAAMRVVESQDDRDIAFAAPTPSQCSAEGSFSEAALTVTCAATNFLQLAATSQTGDAADVRLLETVPMRTIGEGAATQRIGNNGIETICPEDGTLSLELGAYAELGAQAEAGTAQIGTILLDASYD